MTVCYWCGAKDTLADVGKELDDGKYKMVQCSKCKNAYYVVNKEKMNKQKPQTNEEWLRTATTEQLAEWLVDVTQYCFECGLNTNNCVLCPFGKCVDKGFAMEWLKQPHKDAK